MRATQAKALAREIAQPVPLEKRFPACETVRAINLFAFNNPASKTPQNPEFVKL
jgi:hypothetical protein